MDEIEKKIFFFELFVKITISPFFINLLCFIFAVLTCAPSVSIQILFTLRLFQINYIFFKSSNEVWDIFILKISTLFFLKNLITSLLRELGPIVHNILIFLFILKILIFL